MRTNVRLWHWRRNPLKRRSDVAEAWAGLAAVGLMAVGAPVVGAVTAWNVEDSLLQQREHRHPVSAVLTKDALNGFGTGLTSTAVRWTGSDGSVHTGKAQVKTGLTAGTSVTVWLDDQGRPASAPTSAGAADVEGGLAGATAAGSVCAMLLGGVGIVRWRLDRHRTQAWEREWAEVGPQWGHHPA